VERRSFVHKELDRRRIREEERFAEDTARLFRAQRRRVLDRLETLVESSSALSMTKIFPMKAEQRVFREDILPSMTRAYMQFFREAERQGKGQEVKAGENEVFIDFQLADEAAQEFLLDKSFTFSDHVNTTTQDALRATLTEGFADGENITKLQNRVRETFAGTVRSSSVRSLAIARTEIGSVQGVGIVDGFKEAGIRKHEWLSAGDLEVRDHHRIDGQVRVLGKTFSNGLRQPGDPLGLPGEIINCRCTTLPVIEGG
jgi:SPP1 gp7 family putative phage head morphogenesis protein